ncbi:hypothetical protein A3I25_00130 [Candidatus Nomurabacteria bacterium RIFCSPLOWO2_02_FULL_42_17]|uniref:Uncharacterized protein n=2 Tax=Candidatus Nomuraibacteriota TaxID=1752729 RepID=A0A1F6WIU1_9BACT|nr:MAG: hypothetical protein UV08_C0032G0011 [Parcubacteria group bacterium GW2011_GWA2_42_18]OGI81625.1 MAG: hypothetical protein A3B93_01550 [Candidatus Nomurabacteria bacterium RIFCSPHIGHO2_02_FULL_42_24]OGI96938.1 MAG: hypothetical protein A3I25_00130 [Candidatus Nomurabacteria bacterium RIFCSPLOWO2_02_FULL_42_17]
MALSDKRILEAKRKGDIVIFPFKRANLATSSYDLSLGEWYFREQLSKYDNPIFNIWSKEHTDHVWGTKPSRAQTAREALQKYNFKWNGIKPSDKIIMIHPGETILAHTQEFIGGRNHITTMIKSRSSMGRVFIETCKCAGWGDVGFTNRWTFEITNNSRHYTIPLVVGRRVAQMVFFETGPILKTDYVKTGKYQGSRDIKKLVESWKPMMMLPKLWSDREIKK